MMNNTIAEQVIEQLAKYPGRSLNNRALAYNTYRPEPSIRRVTAQLTKAGKVVKTSAGMFKLI